MQDLAKIIYSNRLLKKLIWCLQNFLTMEFYRKICNNCYWSNLYSTHHSKLKKSLILFISFVSVLFFSFFYMPTDPANSNKTSYFLRLRNYILTFKAGITDLVKGILVTIQFKSKSYFEYIQASFVSRDILQLKSSYQI